MPNPDDVPEVDRPAPPVGPNNPMPTEDEDVPSSS